MNKKIMILTCVSVLFLGANNGFAAEPQVKGPQMKPSQEMQMPKPHKKGHDMHGKRLAEELGLTPEQSQKAEEIRKADFEKMKPLMDEMKQLREKMDKMREDNMKAFESILTPEQKIKFKEIKEKHKQEREHFKKGKPHKGHERPEGRAPRPNDEQRPEKPAGEPNVETK